VLVVQRVFRAKRTNLHEKYDYPTRTLARFNRVGDDGLALDLASPQARRFLALLRRHKTAVDPTVATFEAMFTQRQGQVHPGLAVVADHLPAAWKRGLKQADVDLDGRKARRWAQSYQRLLDLTAALHRAGVPLVAGTDDTPGFTLHRELELYVRAGLTPLAALQAATINAARVAGIGERAGSLAAGRPADLLLVDGDPARDISAVRRGVLVVQGAPGLRAVGAVPGAGHPSLRAGGRDPPFRALTRLAPLQRHRSTGWPASRSRSARACT
jgi:hypothetical protein